MADSSQTTVNAPSTDGMIRNLNQTVQERELIKTCPDLIIYLDGKTYLLNPYITNTAANQSYTFVSFNDYIQNFSASYDVDNLIPSCNFTLQVPNFSKYLFQAPGGNNLIDSMMEVQVFAKGYYPSNNGNTVYYRIFKGITSHIANTDNGIFLEISVQCLGVLHLLEHMYVDLNPALISNSERNVTAMGSNQFNMNPYEILADTFLHGITFEGFELNVIGQSKITNNPNDPNSYWVKAVEAGFCEKWQSILVNIRNEVHITGYRPGSVLPLDINGITKELEDSKGSGDPRLQAARLAPAPLKAQNSFNSDYYVDVIKGYLPDMSVGSIQLTNGRIVTRLERIRTIVQLIGYEGYQDLDGTIIFKPPLYNLDVTNIGKSVSPIASTTGAKKPTSLVSITDNTNPFVVHLSEIETESESEDQQAIRATRMTIQPTINPAFQYINDSTTALIRPAITHIDIPKLAKFGLREEPARTLGWLGLNDKVAIYAYAVSELNRANRGWRTYNLTIPLRPELKLGFPMYLPHRDMYGYIKTISISYSYGGAATMTIMLDTLRKRPVFPSVRTNTTNQSDSLVTNPPVVYTTQPNLVMEWTKAPEAPPTSSNPFSPNYSSSTSPDFNPFLISNPTTVSPDCVTPNSSAYLMGVPATQLQPLEKPIYAEDMEVVSARRSQYGTSWATKADTRTKNFRVQNDIATPDDAKNLNGNGQKIVAGSPFFSSANWHDPPNPSVPIYTKTMNSNGGVSTLNGQKIVENVVVSANQTNGGTASVVNNLPNIRNGGININYHQKVISCQPYTDEGGYEVMTPFPWGRWKSLKEALYETHEGYLVENPTSEQAQQISGTDAFLFAGVGSPSTDFSGGLQGEIDNLTNISNQVASATMFEIVNPKPGDKQPNILNSMQPDSNLLLTLDKSNTSAATNAFIVGNTPPQKGSAFALAANIATQNSPNAVGTTIPQPQTQSQAFIGKLINSNQGTVKGIPSNQQYSPAASSPSQSESTLG